MEEARGGRRREDAEGGRGRGRRGPEGTVLCLGGRWIGNGGGRVCANDGEQQAGFDENSGGGGCRRARKTCNQASLPTNGKPLHGRECGKINVSIGTAAVPTEESDRGSLQGEQAARPAAAANGYDTLQRHSVPAEAEALSLSPVARCETVGAKSPAIGKGYRQQASRCMAARRLHGDACRLGYLKVQAFPYDTRTGIITIQMEWALQDRQTTLSRGH
ncbi:hypothetical protein BDZ91DRAFT_817143 [Kalaharituber pfeilii]|nr:hypothetical protein BDZ91DRAFT_817143 [Kalaharituber pfeilii]